MAIAYEWTFAPEVADEEGNADVVKVVHWRLTASEDGMQTTIYGAAALPPANPATFITFDQLDADTVKGWVLAAERLSEAELQSRAGAALAAVRLPTTTPKPAPWSQG